MLVTFGCLSIRACDVSGTARHGTTHRQDDAMSAEMNTLKFEQKSSLDAVQAKDRELHKIQVTGGGARVLKRKL